MRFRPCIDLHGGKVKQIVGSTLQDDSPEELTTNFVADKPPAHYAEMYRHDELTGGHIIKLGSGNEDAAKEALQAWSGGMQLGGGITLDNAEYWLENGASHVIVTSAVFKNGQVDHDTLDILVKRVGRKRLVLDLSCRKRGEDYFIVTDRWQKFTNVVISPENLEILSKSCAEFLIHAADVEGKCAGIETELVEKLGRWVTIPTTYAGGIRDLKDMETIKDLGQGMLDATIGSSLDIFGGTGVKYADVVEFQRNCLAEKMIDSKGKE